MGIYRLFGFAIRKYLFVGFKILLYKSFRIANPKERRIKEILHFVQDDSKDENMISRYKNETTTK